MKNIQLIGLLVIFAWACSEKRNVEKSIKITRDKNGTTVTTTAEKSSGDTTTKPNFKTGVVQLQIRRTHVFSDPSKADNFELNLTGNSLLNSDIRFTITNAAGKMLYQENLKAADLEASMVYEMQKPVATEKQRETFLKKRLNEFFDEENFNTPAIASNDMYDPSFGDETAWKAIKNDKNSVSFSYLTGKENGRRIAYSKLKSKVMLVGNFGG